MHIAYLVGAYLVSCGAVGSLIERIDPISDWLEVEGFPVPLVAGLWPLSLAIVSAIGAALAVVAVGSTLYLAGEVLVGIPERAVRRLRRTRLPSARDVSARESRR